MNLELSEAWNKMWEKLNSWFDALVINLPNIIIAIIVFVTALILSKYIGRFARKLLNRTSLQISMRNVIAKIFSIVVVLIGLFLVLGVLNLSKTLNTVLQVPAFLVWPLALRYKVLWRTVIRALYCRTSKR